MVEQTDGDIMEILQEQESQSLTLAQHYQGFDHSIGHQNRWQIQRTHYILPDLEIKNHIAAISGETVVKITQVEYLNRVIKIIDSFTCTKTPDQHRSHCPSQVQVKKPEYTKKQEASTNSQGPEGKQKQPKNVVKVIFKMFQSWVKNSGPPELNLETTLKYFVNTHGKYNHQLMIKLSKETLLRKAFLAFCDTAGEPLMSGLREERDWLGRSFKRYYYLCSGEAEVEEVSVEQEEESSSKKQFRMEQR